MPIFPPNNDLKLFFFKTCLIILQVVDLPLVPVTTMLLKFFLNKKNKSKSVIIFFLNLVNWFLYFEVSKLIPGLKIIKSTSLMHLFKFKGLLSLNKFFLLSSHM